MNIDLNDWDLTREEFNQWILDNNIYIQANHDPKNRYGVPYSFTFDKEEDLLAFKLKFPLKFYTTPMSAGVFYCPYIPLQFTP